MKHKQEIRSFFLYLFVGGVSTLVEWIPFYFLNSYMSMHYELATVVTFFASTYVNWALGRVLLFKNGSGKGLFLELLGIYAASILGLLFNMGIMWIEVELFHINEMLAKIIATGIVFFWNYGIRRFFIYRSKN